MQFRPIAIAAIGVLAGSLFSSIAVFAWTGPTAAPPGNNIPTPINVGTTDQVKNAGLSLNSLVVFGNSIFTGNVGVGSSNVPGKTLDVSGTIRATGEALARWQAAMASSE